MYRTQEDDDNDVCIMSIQRGRVKGIYMNAHVEL